MRIEILETLAQKDADDLFRWRERVFPVEGKGIGNIRFYRACPPGVSGDVQTAMKAPDSYPPEKQEDAF